MYCDEYGYCTNISLFGPTPVYGLVVLAAFVFIAIVIYNESRR